MEHQAALQQVNLVGSDLHAMVAFCRLLGWEVTHPGYGHLEGAFESRIMLGAIFDYPDVLKPVDVILAAFRGSQAAVSARFAALALSSALLAPVAIGVGRLSRRLSMRIAVPVGIAAAMVQVVGLLRWPLLVPGYAADAASSDPAVAGAARDFFLLASIASRKPDRGRRSGTS